MIESNSFLQRTPLVIDLDGTLIKTDLLVESANEQLIANPLSIFKLFAWLQQSRSDLKANLAELSQIDPASLPYNQALVAWLHQQKALGRKLILATASHRILADKVAGHLGLFDEVLATEGSVNLKAENKRAALVERFGEGGFDYVGNDEPDLVVWRSARKAIVVSSSSSFIERVKALGNLEEVFPAEQLPLGLSLTKALRPHQWIKNLLIFVPLLAAHRFTDGVSLLNAFLAFIIFGLTASSVYILNDLADVADDRHHHRKRFRPFASGNLSLLTGWLAWPTLLLIAFFLSGILLPLSFTLVLGVYFFLTLAYSLKLKQIAMLDVLTLASLYTIRIIAGVAAISVTLSFWLLTFSMFIFLSLAFIKRFNELKSARHSGHEGNIRGRGYVHQDLELVSSMGSGAGYLSVLVLALFIQDAHTSELYGAPQVIWLACPILLYWISRAWLIAHRGQMHDDPIVFAIKDRTSWLVAGCFLGVFALAKVL
jgi:4-hydroxybenzoate polyprenyltransferase